MIGLLALFASFAVAGCGDSTTSPADAAADTASDTASDVASDTASDVASDITNDAPRDVVTDASNDAATDTSTDAAMDTTADVATDAARDAVSDVSTDAMRDASSPSCGSATCAASEICLRQRTLGGAFLPPDDAGMCPAGRHVEGSSCVADFSYRCVARPTCTTVDCACLSALCPSSFMCRGAEASLLTCEQLAP